MTEIKPEDLIITVYPTHPQGRGGMWCGHQHESGIQVYHKPSEITVKCDDHRSQHKNKNECIVILKDLLTPFYIGDIIFTSTGIGEVLDEYSDSWFICKNNEYTLHTDEMGHTEEGYKYKAKQGINKELDALEKEYEEKRKGLVEKLRSL